MRRLLLETKEPSFVWRGEAAPHKTWFLSFTAIPYVFL